jgi:hypothetical protein
MKTLKDEVAIFVKDNKRVRDALTDVFSKEGQPRLSDQTVPLWIKKNDPRLTCISALEVISTWIDKPIEELTTEQ